MSSNKEFPPHIIVNKRKCTQIHLLSDAVPYSKFCIVETAISSINVEDVAHTLPAVHNRINERRNWARQNSSTRRNTIRSLDSDSLEKPNKWKVYRAAWEIAVRPRNNLDGISQVNKKERGELATAKHIF